MKWINSTKIVQWADTKECEVLLPELLRNLIIASSTKFPELSFPSHDSIYKPSWDGKCISKDDCGYTPKGTSLWEFGRDKDYRRKLNKDYSKRTEQTSASIRKKSTFIFVTPRRWASSPPRDKWIAAKKRKKEWRDIKIYDADDLESWLERSPAIGSWLALELKLSTDNIESALDYWNRYICKHNFIPDLVISSREKEKDKILKFLVGDFGVVEVQSSSKPEGICFTIAAAISHDITAAQNFFSRTIVVSTLESLKKITSLHDGLIIIYDSNADDFLNEFDARTNHVINPVSFNVRSSGITIPIPKFQDFVKSLENSGYSYEQALTLAKDSGRSFSALKRILSDSPGRVAWHKGKDVLELLPIFFAHKFDENKPGDKQVIENFSSIDYNSYKEKLKEWSLISDHPIAHLANYWRVISSYDLLHVLSRRIAEHHLIQFEDIFLKVFDEIDPALDLEPKMRFAAALFNKESAVSGRLKEGLCQTLVLLAVYGESSGMKINFGIQEWVDSIIRRLLTSRETSFWLSIESKLHLIAEASPNSFLKALEEIIKEKPGVVSSMFSEKDFDLFTPSYYIHILWALEALAWGPMQLSRVTMILSNLVKLDKGIKTVNKPINSLRQIFSLWLPQTYASIESRFQALELIIKRDPEVGFKLLKDLAPKPSDTGFYNYKPTLRLRDFVVRKVTHEEWMTGISFVRKKLTEIAQNDCNKWSQIIDFIDDFNGTDREEMITELINQTNLVGDKDELRETLRSFIHRHESYHSQPWSLKQKDLNPLKKLYESLLINNIDKYFWYFNVDTIDVHGESNENHDELLKRTNKKRRDAIIAILDSEGFDGILELSKKVDKPWVVGNTLAEIKKDFDDRIMASLLSNSEKTDAMSMGYIYCRSKSEDFAWIEKWALYIAKENDVARLTNFFLYLEPNSKIWDFLKDISPEADISYWQKASFQYGHFKNSDEDLTKCVRNLNRQRRFVSSINLIQMDRGKFHVDLIYESLEGLAISPIEDARKLQFGSHGIQELFLVLDNSSISHDRIRQLEWYYLQILNDTPHHRPPKYLHEALTKDPKFFAEVLSWIYLPEYQTLKNEIDEAERKKVASRAKNADELLDTWTNLPGETEDHKLSEKILKTWIQEAIVECKKLDRMVSGYYIIGKLLGISRERTPLWPQQELCQIIEEIDNEELNKGFINGAINGSRVRASFRPSGSNDEKRQSEYYKSLSENNSNQYPLVGRLLLEIANCYEHLARRWNIRDDQRDLEG